MTEQSATPNEKQELPVQWVEDDGFEITPSVHSPAGARLLLNPPLIQGELKLPPLQTP
jgi:hypothetical protein